VVRSADQWGAITHRLVISIDPKPALAVVAVEQRLSQSEESTTLLRVLAAAVVPTGRVQETDKLVLRVHSPLMGRAPLAQTVGATMQQVAAAAAVY
jgi:hypothetical protein